MSPDQNGIATLSIGSEAWRGMNGGEIFQEMLPYASRSCGRALGDLCHT